MIRIEIPGWESLDICHIVMDYKWNCRCGRSISGRGKGKDSEIKRDGAAVYPDSRYLWYGEGAVPRFGNRGYDVSAGRSGRVHGRNCKGLSGGVVCLGNGLNDIQMFDAADLSIAVLEKEGLCGRLLNHADVLVPSFTAGLDLLLKPNRLRATLRT